MTFGSTIHNQPISYDMAPPELERWNTVGTEHRPFDSSIGPFNNGRRPFTLHVRGYCHPYPPGETTFNDHDMNGNSVQRLVRIEALTPDEIENFTQAARRDVDSVWNNKLFLISPDFTRGYAHLGDPVPPPLECRVELEWVTSPQNAHLRLLLLKARDPSNGNVSSLPRSNCELGGANWWQDFWAFLGDLGGQVDMTMHTFQAGSLQFNVKHLHPGGCEVPTAAVGPQRQAGAELQAHCVYPTGQNPDGTRTGPPCGKPVLGLYQTVFAHEFGHYMGLDHVCAGRGYIRNSSREYGEGHGTAAIRDIMGSGDVVTERVGSVWEEQLAVHRYFPQYSWMPTTEAPPTVRRIRTISSRDSHWA